jgi:hypothetical protein
MLDSIYKGSYSLDLDTFLMKAEMQGNIPMIMMQDLYHVGKKFKNLLLSPS